MNLKSLLTASVAVGLLLAAGISFAQNPSISVSFSRNSIQEGKSTTVTMTFRGLPLNTNMRYHGCVRENFPDCEGTGLGGVFDFFTGDSSTLTRTGTILGSCPVGQYHLDVDLRNASDAILIQDSVRFSVGFPFLSLNGAFHRLGAIGLLFRGFDPELNVEIWGITPESEGYILLRITQSQIDAAPPQSFVARSEDGRAVVRVGAAPNRDVTLSLGPSDEGKVHHVTLARNLNGKIISTFDTQEDWPSGQLPATIITTSQSAPGNDPASVFAPPATPQDPRADGSLVHTVQPGDTINAIAQAYGVARQLIIERNQLAHGGRWIYPGQQLIIRDASTEASAVTVNEGDELPEPVFKGDTP